MNDREHPQLMSPGNTEASHEESTGARAPIMDMDIFANLRDVVRSHYLWQWDESAVPTQELIKELTSQINHDPQFRLVGDIEVEESVFQVTLWLEESMVYSLASVDVMVLDTLQVDLGRCAILARELTRQGLEYHLVTFGEGRAQQLHINVIGPRMQQIRDLGTLVAPTANTFSA